MFECTSKQLSEANLEINILADEILGWNNLFK